jgi:hypothetical protein
MEEKKDPTKPKVSIANSDSKLTKREEIASRILAGMAQNDFVIRNVYEDGSYDKIASLDMCIDFAIEATDSLIRKLRKTKQEEE